MKTTFTPDENYKEIIQRYCFKADRTLSNLSAPSRRNLNEVMPVLFKKWYFASLMDNTIISPATLLRSETKDLFSNGYFADCDLNIKNNKFDISYVVVSAKNHPFLDDLKTFLGFCSPSIELDENGCVKQNVKKSISENLSFNDKYYIDYISNIALNLGLLEKIPSLFVSVYSVSPKCVDFFKKDSLEALKDILDATFDICTAKIVYDLLLPEKSFSAASFKSYFENATSVNDMIRDIYKSVDINIEDTLEKCTNNQIYSEDHELLSSVNYVGHLLDRHFITPLSIYLRLIRPLYPTTDDLTESLNFITDILAINGFAEAEIFSPPNLYTFTPLGEAFVGSVKGILNDNIPQSISLKSIYDTLEKGFSAEKFNLDIDDFMSANKDIYTLKVSYKDEPQKWIDFEVEADMVLYSLFVEITDVFAIGESDRFSFKKQTENIEKVYTPGGFNDPEVFTISSVLSEIGEEISLEIHTCSVIMLICLIKKQKGKAGIIYPRPVRESKKMDSLRETYE